MRRFTVARAFVLLLLGVGIGTTVFLAQHLSPEAIQAQVDEALGRFFLAKFETEAVILDLETGVEVKGLKVLYEDGTPAAEVERILLAVDRRELLRGTVMIRQLDLHGVILRPRGVPGDPGAVGFPGVLRPPPEDEPPIESPLRPVLRILPGRGGSRIELIEWAALDAGLAPSLECEALEAHPEGATGYEVTLTLRGGRVGKMELEGFADPVANTFHGKAVIENLAWRRKDVLELADSLREGLPPIEVAGTADIEIEASGRLEPFDPEKVSGRAQLKDLRGAFGNLHTGEHAGLPFLLRDGRGTILFDGEGFEVRDVVAAYDGPGGVSGELRFGLTLPLDRIDTDMDLRLEGKRIAASNEDLRQLLPQDIVEGIIDPFLLAGTFDFSVRILRRADRPERIWANLLMSDGRFDYAGRLDELTGRRFGFRYPLDRCSGAIRIETNVETGKGLALVIELEELRGKNRIARPVAGGPTDVAVTAEGRVVGYRVDAPRPLEDLDLSIEVRELPIDEKLTRAFTTAGSGVPYDAFAFTGWADPVRIRLKRDGFGDNVPRASYEFNLRDCTIAYKGFPLPLTGLTGRARSQDLPTAPGEPERREISIEGLRANAEGGGLVTGGGTVVQETGRPDRIDLRIRATDLALGQAVERALLDAPEIGDATIDLWRTLRPRGRVDVEVEVGGASDAKVDIDLAGKAGLSGYGAIEFPIEELEGHVIYDQEGVVLRDISGRVGEGRARVDGELGADGSFRLASSVRNLALDEGCQQLLAELSPEVRPVLERFRCGRESSIDISVNAGRTGRDGPLTIDAELGRMDIHTSFGETPLMLQGGPLRIERDRLAAKDLWLRSGDAAVHVIEGSLPRGGARRGWVLFDARNLQPRLHFAPLFGEGYRTVLGDNSRVNLDQLRAEFDIEDRSVVLSGDLELHRHEMRDPAPDTLEPTGVAGLAPLTIRMPARPGEPIRFFGVVQFRGLNMNLPVDVRDMRGELRVADGRLGENFGFRGAVIGAQLTVFERHFEDLSLNIEYDPHFLRLNGIESRLYAGRMRGNIDVHLVEPSAFRVQLRAEEVELGEMLERDMSRDDRLSGKVAMFLEFESPSGELQDISGRGQVRVTEGQLFKIPGVRSILAVIGRVTPLSDDIRFKEAEVDFALDGELFRIHRYLLSTPVNDIRGHGTISLYGDLDLVVEPQVTRLIDLPRLVNVPVLSAIRNLWHRTVYAIRLEGTLDSPAIRLHAFPLVRRERKPYVQSAHAGRVERMRPRILPGPPGPLQ